MNIAYDVSYFGVAQRSPKDRTGIYRVVKNVLLGLVEGGVDVSLYAATDLADITAYVDEHPVLKKLPLPKPNDESKRQRKIREYLERYAAKEDGIGRLVRHYFPSVGRFRRESESILRQASVYHSPFLGIPEQVREHKHLRCFLTVYDLIPILFPHYVNLQGTSWTENAIRSLGPEDWVFSISQATKNDLCAFNKQVDPDRVIVNYLAASPELFYPCQDAALMQQVKRKYGVPDDGVYFLGLGNLAPHKNFGHIIRCFSELLEQEALPDLHLLVVGSAIWQYESLFEETKAHPLLKERVLFTGRVADSDLAALYSGALGFVYMSFYEGFGLPPLEAMQCGVPVVTSNTSSLPEVVGDAGVMLDPGDGDGLCQAMLGLYNDGRLRERMAEASLRRAAQFSWQRCVEQVMDAYAMAPQKA